MRTKWTLDAADAAFVAAECLRHARSKGWRISVAVVDESGHLLHLVRDDGARFQTASVAQRKAETAAMNRTSTAVTEAIVRERLTMLAFGDRLPLQGGLPVMHGAECVGAVGVSGRASEEDEEVAQCGLDAFAEQESDRDEGATE